MIHIRNNYHFILLKNKDMIKTMIIAQSTIIVFLFIRILIIAIKIPLKWNWPDDLHQANNIILRLVQLLLKLLQPLGSIVFPTLEQILLE